MNVKRLLSLLLFFSVFFLGKNNAQKWETGFQTGLILTAMKTEYRLYARLEDEKEPLYLGTHLNTYFKLKLNKRIGISFEPGYILKSDATPSGRRVIRLHYFNVPVLVNIEAGKNFFLSFGSELAYLARIQLPPSSTITKRYKNRVEPSILFGVHCRIKRMDLGLRYGKSLRSIVEGIIIQTDVFKPRYIQLFSRYLFVN